MIGAQPYELKANPYKVRAWATGDYMHAGWSTDPGKAYVYKTWKEAFVELCRGRSFRIVDVSVLEERWYLGEWDNNMPEPGWDRHVFTVEEMFGAQFVDRS